MSGSLVNRMLGQAVGGIQLNFSPFILNIFVFLSIQFLLRTSDSRIGKSFSTKTSLTFLSFWIQASHLNPFQFLGFKTSFHFYYQYHSLYFYSLSLLHYIDIRSILLFAYEVLGVLTLFWIDYGHAATFVIPLVLKFYPSGK